MDLQFTSTKWIVVILAMKIICSTADDEFHSVLGKAIYIPEEDLLGSIPNGITFFENISAGCLRRQDTATTMKDQTMFNNTSEFYKSIATETNLKASYEAAFSLGFTLDVTTKHVSGNKRAVSGTSLNLATISHELHFSPNCLYETPLQQRVLDDFAQLGTTISKPWYKSSWREYQHFLETHGSHVITGITYGSRVNHYAFADASSSHNARDLTVKACASFGLSVGVSVSACSGVTKEEISKVSKSKITTSTTVKGGTVDTRNRLVYQRTNELLVQFLNEGHTNASPIGFTLTPIWEILRRQRGNNNAHLVAVNLQYYYEGYLNFACPYRPGKRGPDLQRFDHAEHSTPDHPVYECSLAPPSCHVKSDCRYHVGVWCTCRGDSCIHHGEIKLETGAKRKTAAPYYGHHGGSHGCGWKLWGSICTCKYPLTKRTVIFK